MQNGVKRTVPIIRLKLLIRDDTERIRQETLQALADELGRYFGSSPAGTWVEADYLPAEQYAENLCELAEDVKPTLVYVLRHHLPHQEELAREASELARIVANRLQRPRRNTHIFYEPAGKGRVAIGGTLIR